MKLNKIYGLGILVVLSVLVLPVIMATTTINLPTASSSNSGTFIVNCTTDVSDPLNMTIHYNATGGWVMGSTQHFC